MYSTKIEFDKISKLPYKVWIVCEGRRNKIVGEFKDEKTAKHYAQFDILRSKKEEEE